MKIYRRLAEAGLTELLLGLLFGLFVLMLREHPSVLMYLAAGSILLAIASFIYTFLIKKGEGQRYRGELEALPHIRSDISSLPAESKISICGTAATAIVYIANDVYRALKRGVDFDVYLIHPTDLLVERLAGMEPDFEKRVFDPITHQLTTQEGIRERLGADWTDGILQHLKRDGKLCTVHDKEDSKCSLHSRIICTSAELWKRVAQRITRNDPGAHPGNLRIRYYRRIPFIKAWRFQRSDGRVWYYVADYLYYPGVGIDNPVRRIEKRGQLDQRGDGVQGFINTDRIDAHFDMIDSQSESWQPKAAQTNEVQALLPEAQPQAQNALNRKPDKHGTRSGGNTGRHDKKRALSEIRSLKV